VWPGCVWGLVNRILRRRLDGRGLARLLNTCLSSCSAIAACRGARRPDDNDPILHVSGPNLMYAPAAKLTKCPKGLHTSRRTLKGRTKGVLMPYKEDRS